MDKQYAEKLKCWVESARKPIETMTNKELVAALVDEVFSRKASAVTDWEQELKDEIFKRMTMKCPLSECGADRGDSL